MDTVDKIKLGSETAKGGFRNEDDVIDRFNNWEKDTTAQKWLKAMGYVVAEIEFVKAVKITGGHKADIQVQIRISIKLREEIDCQNLQVKLVSNPQGFNQIDKRKVDNYIEMWDIDEDIVKLLKYFTGELPPYIKNPRDKRRMFSDELSTKDRNKLLTFFKKNKTLIITDILKGRGKFSAEWMLVILKNNDDEIKWALKPMNFVLNFYDGDVAATPRGSFRIGKITIQRKGGDGGRPSANMLQFKINPAFLVN